jgi:ABC-type dipeptide/oligopeptide/nickel transport system permease component
VPSVRVLSYAGRFLLAPAANVLAIVVCVFVLLNALPSDPARVRLGTRYNERDAQAIRREYGLDRPLPEQFAIYVGEIARGDFGVSIRTGENIADGLAARLPVSTALVALSFVIAAAVVPLAVLAALRPHRVFDLLEGLLLDLSVVPPFVTGALVIFAAAALFDVSLLSGFTGATSDLVVPALLLSAFPAFALYKITRDTLSETLGQPFIESYRAFGFPPGRVVRMALRSCAPPILGITTNLVAYYLSSIFVVEFLFALGGIGAWGVNSARNYDTPVVLATVLVSGVVYNAVSAFTSALLSLLDRGRAA